MKMFRNLHICIILVAAALAAIAAPARAGGVKQSVEMIAGPLESLPDATCNGTTSVIAPADPNGECWLLGNVGSNIARIGDSLCASNRCVALAPNATITICTTAAISCYSASGTTISMTEVTQ